MKKKQQSSSIQDINPEHYNELSRQADVEMGKRSISSAFIYFGFVLVAIFASPYARDYPTVMLVVGAAILIIGAERLYLALSLKKFYPLRMALWRKLFVIGVILIASCWGLFSCLTIALYGLSQWTTFLVILMTAGASAAAITSLSPNLSLLRWYLIFMIGPSLVMSLITGGKQGYAIASLIAFYLLFLMMQGKNQNREYWRAITNNALLEEARRYARNIIDSSLDIIIAVDKERKIVEFNKAAQKTFGYSAEEISGKHVDILYKDPEEGLKINKVIRETGQFTGEIANKRKNGETFPSFLSASILRDTEGRFVGVMGISRDITEQKRSEYALKESEERYQDLCENASDIIQSVLPDGRFAYVNRSWRETLGYKEEEIAGLSVFDIIHPDYQAHCVQIFQELLSGEKFDKVEVVFVTNEGEDIVVEGNINCRFVNGKPVATRGIFRNITNRRKIESMKNEFISTVSHELRTPLTSIHGSLGMLVGGISGELPTQAKDIIDIAYRNSERLRNLIDDILDFEKMEAEKMAFHFQSQELMPLVEQALEVNRPYAEQFGVEFVLEKTSPGARVNVDSERLIQVFTNLLSNATRFSPPNDTVEISVSRHGEAIRVAITDHGPGIPKAFRNRVFQKFAQADPCAARQSGGTGLGLSIAKMIVEKHGGQIGFETETDVGTTFYFDLPEWNEQEVAG
jgi:PAS domain S-box-containing protein